MCFIVPPSELKGDNCHALLLSHLTSPSTEAWLFDWWHIGRVDAILLFLKYPEKDSIWKTHFYGIEYLRPLLVAVLSLSIIYNNLLLGLSIFEALTLVNKILLRDGNRQTHTEALVEECGWDHGVGSRGQATELDCCPATLLCLSLLASLVSLGTFPNCSVSCFLTSTISADNILREVRAKSGRWLVLNKMLAVSFLEDRN